jgi:monofunctional biosynthetic peptidoglycan transglycosylase
MFIGLMLVLKFIWGWIKRILFFGLLASIVSVLIFKYVMVPFTPLMVSRALGHMIDGQTPKLKKSWVSLDEMSNEMPLAAICAEDGNFLTHNGFDFEAMQKAWKYNNKHGDKKPIKGGSTISQQVAKNVFLWQGRTYLRKGLEVYFTFLIELFWSKKRIMEVYLNVIEMGPGVYGAEAAANYYFHKPASKLTKSESALIAAILPNPIRWSAAKPTPYITKKKNWILRHMPQMELKEF